jgi:hypothetical protein
LIPRFLVVGLAALLPIAVGCGARSPTPRPAEADKDAAYIPTGLGDKLVYERAIRDKAGESKGVVTELITAVDRTDGLVVTVEYRYGDEPKPRRIYRFRATDEGVYWIGNNGQVFDAPECILKLPVRAGDTWESPLGGQPDTPVRYTTNKEEEVEVPAGKFRAVRIDSMVKVKGITLGTTDWYARGVGLVKTTTRANDAEDEVDEVKVLTSFTPGKK